MTFQFKKASKEQAKLRLAVFGPSGSGKTFSALRIATGLGGRVAVIDTERGSASKYADRFEFDVLELDKFGTRVYVEAIKAAQQAGYDVLVIDSLTHGWHDLLQEIDRIAKARFGGNTWSAWSEGTPKQRAMVDAILQFSGHVIATMRTKTEWDVQRDNKGRVKPVRVGTSPEQGKGIEYEFDLLMEISVDHIATVIKDRTGRFQDETFTPDEDFGESLAAWLADGAAPTLKRKPSEGGNSKTRPLSAEALIEFLRRKVETDNGEPITEKQAPFVARKWQEAYAPAGDAEKRYHLALHQIWNVTSAKELSKAQAKATLDWLLVKDGPDSSGDTQLHPAAAAEAAAVWKLALVEQGQTEMEMPEGREGDK